MDCSLICINYFQTPKFRVPPFIYRVTCHLSPRLFCDFNADWQGVETGERAGPKERKLRLKTWLSQCQAVLSSLSVRQIPPDGQTDRRTDGQGLRNGLGTLQLAHSKCVCKKFKSHPAAGGAEGLRCSHLNKYQDEPDDDDGDAVIAIANK